MSENLLKTKDSKVKNAEKYALKYFNDLKHHFNLTDIQLVKILNNCTRHFKKNENKKKWWQFFT